MWKHFSKDMFGDARIVCGDKVGRPGDMGLKGTGNLFGDK